MEKVVANMILKDLTLASRDPRVALMISHVSATP